MALDNVHGSPSPNTPRPRRGRTSIRPFQGRLIISFLSVAMPPAIKSVRLADASFFYLLFTIHDSLDLWRRWRRITVLIAKQDDATMLDDGASQASAVVEQ